MIIFYLQVFLSILLDILFGDPRWYPHPVRIIGKLITSSEKWTRRLLTDAYLAGLLTVIVVLLITGSVVLTVLSLVYAASWIAGDVISIILLYTTIAGRDLIVHSNCVYGVLNTENSVEKGRVEVGKIVGRDTSELGADGICKACVETVAENMVDGITSPLFFAVLASLASPLTPMTPIGCAVLGAFLYKAVNTMDSMIGYKNEAYIHFGTAAAKLDDVVNLIPARISGVCVIITAFFLKLDYRGAARIFIRDRLQHSSPNAGHTEAAVAGALGIRLGGPSTYFGKVVDKPYMGDVGHSLVPMDIKKTNHLVVVGSIVFILFIMLIRSLFPF